MTNEEPRIVDRRASSRPESDGAPEETTTEATNENELATQLAEEKAKAESYLASWQRAAADYQNLKRRSDQEREEYSRLGSAALMINLLPIVDDMDRALQNVDSTIAGMTWLEGIRLIQRKLQSLLDAYDVKEIEADGQAFDPNVHEAVMFGEGEDGKVIGVVQKGYKLGGRVLRPSMVVVGKKEN